VRVTTRLSEDEVLSRWRTAGIFGGGSPDAAAVLQLFHKIRIFKNILAQISAEKTRFQMSE